MALEVRSFDLFFSGKNRSREVPLQDLDDFRTSAPAGRGLTHRVPLCAQSPISLARCKLDPA